MLPSSRTHEGMPARVPMHRAEPCSLGMTTAMCERGSPTGAAAGKSLMALAMAPAGKSRYVRCVALRCIAYSVRAQQDY